jgi:hypothetical protein
MSNQTQPRRRHRIDPETLGRRRTVTAEDRAKLADDKAKLERVQRWVMSSLTIITILHLSVGLVLAAVVMDPDRGVDRYGLVVIAGILGVGAVAAGLALHKRSAWSLWLLLGWLPTVTGVVLLNR